MNHHRKLQWRGKKKQQNFDNNIYANAKRKIL